MTIEVNPQSQSLKAILLLSVEPYVAGARDSQKFFNPDLTKVSVTVNGSLNRLYNEGLGPSGLWEAVRGFFVKKSNKTQYMNATKFYTEDKFGLLIDLRSMSDQGMHGSRTRLVNSQDGVQIELKRTTSGSGNFICQVFTISDSQMNIMGQQLESVQF